MLSSYAYANSCFRWIRKHGGKTFLDGGNSHPQTFWEILSEEHRKWGCPFPPVSPAHHRRSLAMMRDVDCVLAPSLFVEQSFLQHGFRPKQILRVPYATNQKVFTPASQRPADRPFTVINTGGLSLRKGTPYLLEALRLLWREVPNLRILLTRQVSDSIRPILTRYHDLPISWSGTLNHIDLARRLQSADLFILPSLEEGMARTALEAMACGLPVVLTSHTGANDLVVEGKTGSVVAIRDPNAICRQALFWWGKIQLGRRPAILRPMSGLETFDGKQQFIRQILKQLSYTKI
jgi:glycosyltransferase involved in cell wall biosynthesis